MHVEKTHGVRHLVCRCATEAEVPSASTSIDCANCVTPEEIKTVRARNTHNLTARTAKRPGSDRPSSKKCRVQAFSQCPATASFSITSAQRSEPESDRQGRPRPAHQRSNYPMFCGDNWSGRQARIRICHSPRRR